LVSDPPRPGRWHTREDSGLRLDAEGRWWHDDEPIEHPRILEAFNKGLVPTDDARFKLVFGRDWCFVHVEDAAYAVLHLVENSGALALALSNGSQEHLDPTTLKVGPHGVVFCQVMNGRAKARFSRDAQFELGSRLEARGSELFLRLGAREVRVPVALLQPLE
jgi:uncharacterized protein